MKQKIHKLSALFFGAAFGIATVGFMAACEEDDDSSSSSSNNNTQCGEGWVYAGSSASASASACVATCEGRGASLYNYTNAGACCCYY